jgi:oligopeptide/dipeptide ABC transporter, ATP-binding protein, C-terminal domain
MTDQRTASMPKRQSDTTPILEARDLEVHIPSSGGRTIRAVDGVSLALYPGQITALVGESGSGKTTIARVFSLIYRPTSGALLYDGKPVKMHRRHERAYFNQVQLIFQDPFASLNALKKVSYILGRAIRIHRIAALPSAVRAKTIELLEQVHLSPGTSFIDRYPTDMSGGQRQRIAIARSLAMNPRVILADEPTSMLDASIRLGVLNLLDTLRREQNLAVLYITHDIASARYLSDRIDVMFGGIIVESGETEAVVSDPKHPYTRQLLGAAPDPARYKGSGRSILSDIADASPIDNTVEYPGCRFVSRCPLAMAKCATQVPPIFTSGTRSTACWLAEDDPEFTDHEPGTTAPHHTAAGNTPATTTTEGATRQ